MNYFAGIDIGTTHTKLVVVDAQLRLLGQWKRGYRQGFGDRLNATEIRAHCIDLLEEAAAVLPPAGVLFVGFSAAMHSLVPVDKNGEALGDLVTWADNNSQPWVEAHRDAAHMLFMATGTPFHSMTPLAKLGYWRQVNPELWQRMHMAVGIKEFVWFHLANEWVVDHSIASATGLFDIDARTWFPPALALAGIGEERLPMPVSVLHASPLRCAIPGLTCPVYLVIGGSDGCLAQLGSNLLQPGAAALTIGTSGAIRVTRPSAERDPSGQLFTYILDDELYVQGAPMNNGGLALQWWNHDVMQGGLDPAATMQAFEKDLAATPAGAEGLLCIPWFAGERAPVWNASARGSFHFVSTRHGHAHFGRAVLEGICLQFRLLAELLERQAGTLSSLYASGGFTASTAWLQLMADVMQRPLYVPASPVDASALGAIAMAMRVAGQCADWSAFAAINRQPEDRYHGQEPTKKIYDTQFDIFKALCRS